MLEKFLMTRREVSFRYWQLLLVLAAFALLVVGFGAGVHRAITKPDRAGPFAKSALAVARIPVDAKTVLKALSGRSHPARSGQQRFSGQSGFQRFAPATGEEGLLLLSRFDGDRQRGIVEVLDLRDGSVLHTYSVDEAKIHATTKARIPWVDPQTDKDRSRFFLSHPVATPEGGLVFHGMYTPLVKIDACSRIEWIADDIFHHAIEPAEDGGFYTASVLYPATIRGQSDTFADDAIVKVSADGEVLWKRSVAQIAIASGLKHQALVPAGRKDDPFHLNDVQPVTDDGPHWQKGDLLLSLRHPSSVWLYRPSTDQLVWHQEGHWMMQHDVDVIDDHRISVFDNNTAQLRSGEKSSAQIMPSSST
ncbi:arylsulfotransferase family protein [Parvularcula lutaonensis]|uniref:Arylsulfotransferase family protein n=1 Tax=Parvularcula lutaonensis TaxID=491923 RepID=A0ABV7MHS3_9PROT|nr:arylsulfotransferase family protein [Parvularcula lutaonensis]GGY55018.1 hypothetical protein GCM10007148_25980 [Parvularcula lutaonensis]